ncbi:hypothetical protein KAFR_0A05620 [Kazachstania africana CBS 2517]|uniref:RING-type domain-containing protein n=1 Tax=Kazachstania africana (strain ATCC 22294 / BCRC 22015 / CBS 2517 / CECT 1963 / NBRC 1671 / NRRL Y-8276) TaxID=1071382 RepID=H2ANP7_KAZAF|nr:hypothetical protein KAFR_0A05620 [Kazachstania africana CBS 2517]CCF55997.1 hypothetical protein KAFR_0A05620 [Kazachstania africana CBS 2517]
MSSTNSRPDANFPKKNEVEDKKDGPMHNSSIEKRNSKKEKSSSNRARGGQKSTNNHGRRRRMGQHRRQQNYARAENLKNEHGYDLDLSIQEELTSGDFKLRGRRTQVSINHLLDFQLPEIERSKDLDVKARRNLRRNERGREHINLVGDSFINVNYRMLVNGRYDYEEQSCDPNIPIPDEKVVGVIVPKGQNCPICLCEEPVAPRMVTCGHIFCCSCLINFFSIDETITNKETGYTKKKKYKDCPLCGSIIRPQRVKPVVYEEENTIPVFKQSPSPGIVSTFYLMCKPLESMLPLPVTLKRDPRKIGNFPPVHLKEVASFGRIVKCDTQYSLELLQQDIDAIKVQLDIDKALYNQDEKYSKLAIEDVNTKIASVLSEEADNLTNTITEALDRLDLDTDVKSIYDDSTAHFFLQTTFHSPTKFFLSPLDIKILLTVFHNYSKFPDILEAIVENVHYGSIVTEQLIRRHKYISYLPIGTEIAFVDIDWRNVPFVTKEIYSQFASELNSRRREFKIKKQKEDKRKKLYQQKLEEEQAEFYRRDYSNYTPTSDMIHLNTVGDSNLALTSLPPSKTPLGTASENEDSSKKKSYEERTIWGTSISVIPDEKTSRENQDFEDMLLQRMQQETDNSQSSGKSKGRKKKKGKVLLFST